MYIHLSVKWIDYTRSRESDSRYVYTNLLRSTGKNFQYEILYLLRASRFVVVLFLNNVHELLSVFIRSSATENRQVVSQSSCDIDTVIHIWASAIMFYQRKKKLLFESNWFTVESNVQKSIRDTNIKIEYVLNRKNSQNSIGKRW